MRRFAIWVADNLSPVGKQDMPLIFNDERQEKLWEEVRALLRYED